MKNETVIVTRHSSLVQYLEETGIVEIDTTVISHAMVDDVEGKDVIGVLPLRLAALAASVTEVPLAITPAMRGKELCIDTLREIAGKPVKYKVEIISG